ncbi:hypothetical protein BDR26DRAFT_898405 [Obelidium mucronatum]|nr:hypothetical protein BDR26DRAFT_898405 [Obelidium mucronatum]
MDPNNALSKKNQSSITIAIIGPYNWLPGLSYNRYEVVGGYDNLNVKKYSDLSQWNYDSWWFFNQVAITLAIESINNDTLILPNTTIRIRRFRNNRNPLGYADGPTGIALSYEIATRYPGIVRFVVIFSSERKTLGGWF